MGIQSNFSYIHGMQEKVFTAKRMLKHFSHNNRTSSVFKLSINFKAIKSKLVFSEDYQLTKDLVMPENTVNVQLNNT